MKDPEPFLRLTIDLPVNLKKKIRRIAYLKETSVTKIITQMIKDLPEPK